MTGTLVGTACGAIVGGAYLMGGMAQAAAQHHRVTKIAGVASGSYSEESLGRVVDQMSPGALSVAARHDPYTSAGAAQRDRQASLFAARLERRTTPGGSQTTGLLMKASLRGAFNPAAQPFRLNGALDDSRDLECLTQAVYYEARGETPSGQAAVAQVVLNRARHPAFPKSVCGVVFQGASSGGVCQFSFACDGSMRKRRESGAWARAERVAARALSGEVMSTVGNATHFHTINVSPGWGPRLTRVAQVGLHIFYRFGGRRGAPGAFENDPTPSGPDIGDRPLYAGLSPSEPVPYTSLPKSQEVVFIAATAVAPGPMTVTARGIGGPVGDVVEPASAPKAKPVAATPAPRARSVDTAGGPAKPEVKAEATPLRTSQPSSSSAS
ncbi:MAG: cell wall hydrolase [Caulobacter sp.]|nr:cell wall hydrolase [Caulobacter sp.]